MNRNNDPRGYRQTAPASQQQPTTHSATTAQTPAADPLQQKIQQLEANLNSVRDELGKVRGLEDEITNLKTELNRLRAHDPAADVREQTTSLQAKLDEYAKGLKQALDKTESYSTRLTKTLDEKEVLARKVSELEKDKTQLAQDLSTARFNYSEKDKDNVQLKAQLKTEQSKTQDLEIAKKRLEGENLSLKGNVDTLTTQLQNAQTEKAQLQQSLNNADARLKTIETDLRAEQSHKAQLQGQHTDVLQKAEQLRQQLAQKLEELEALDKQLKFVDPAVKELRRQPDLCRRIKLANISDDHQTALAQCVAVLAQKKSLERLVDALKDACEQGQRAMTEGERELLAKAVQWFNYQHADEDAYQLVDAHVGDRVSVDMHMRSAHTPIGERIAAVWMPAIVRGSSYVHKALVKTH